MTTQRLSRKITWVFPIAALALIIALALMSTGKVSSDGPFPADCDDNGGAVSIGESSAGDPVHGFTLIYDVEVSNTGGDAPCDVTGLSVTLILPNGDAVLVVDNIDMDPDEVINCPGDGDCSAAASEYDYDINADDETGPVDSSCPPVELGGDFPRQVTAFTTTNGTGTAHLGNIDGFFDGCATFPTGVLHTPEVTTEIHLDPTPHSDIQGSTVLIGTDVHDQVTVEAPLNPDPERFGSPTGDVQFELFLNNDCTPAGSLGSQIGLAGDPLQAESVSAEVPSGGLSYIAHYFSDTNFFLDSDGPCEFVNGDKLTPTITTVIHDSNHNPLAQGATIGTPALVHDTVIVAGPDGQPSPTGSVTFIRHDNITCTSVVDQEVGVALGTGEGGAGTAASTPFNTPDNNISYQVTYTGDSNYLSGGVDDADPDCEFLREVSIGGITVFSGESGSSVGTIALLAGSLAAVLAIATAGGWYTRRRWMGNN